MLGLYKQDRTHYNGPEPPDIQHAFICFLRGLRGKKVVMQRKLEERGEAWAVPAVILLFLVHTICDFLGLIIRKILLEATMMKLSSDRDSHTR